MTRRETRKTRSGRRSRIEAEGLESRNLLSGVGAVGTTELEVHHPPVPVTPEVMVVHFVPPGPQTISAKLTPEVMAVGSGTSGAGGGKFVADVKKAPPVNWVADAKVDFHPPQPIHPPVPIHPPTPVISTGPSVYPPEPCVSTGPRLYPPEPIIPTGPSVHPPEPIIPTGPSVHPPEPCISRGPAPQILIGLHPTKAVVDGPYQTSVWGGIESIGTIKKG
jgi:hypothetical protein